MAWFDRYGQWSVFFGRLIPGVRSLISIPAGIDRMNLVRFTLMTLAGSALWNALLIALGVWLGERYELVEQYIGQYSNLIYAIIAVTLAVILTILLLRARRRREARAQDDAATTSTSSSEQPAGQTTNRDAPRP